MVSMIKGRTLKITGRKHIYAQSICEVTGKKVRKTTGCSTNREATAWASEWEKQLNASGDGDTEWEEFREAFTFNHLRKRRQASSRSYESVLDSLEAYAKPKNLQSVNLRFLDGWVTSLEVRGLAPASVASYVRIVKCSLQWAVDKEMLAMLPKIPKVESSQSHRGRALSADEIQTIIARYHQS